jgi:hypothetical protein
MIAPLQTYVLDVTDFYGHWELSCLVMLFRWLPLKLRMLGMEVHHILVLGMENVTVATELNVVVIMAVDTLNG